MKGSLHRLNHNEEEDNDCNPKSPPLHIFAVVTPELQQAARFVIVENLLGNNEAIPPIVKFLNISVFCFEITAGTGSWVKNEILSHSVLFLAEPFPNFRVKTGQE